MERPVLVAAVINTEEVRDDEIPIRLSLLFREMFDDF